MERQDLLGMMSRLELAGMRAAYDEVLASGLKRKHGVQDILGDLLKAEIAGKQARSIKYQLTTARLRWPRSSPTSPSPGRRSTKRCCANSPAAASSICSATSC